ncbi:hypothetical protein D3C81_1427770 [compost metagenome]
MPTAGAQHAALLQVKGYAAEQLRRQRQIKQTVSGNAKSRFHGFGQFSELAVAINVIDVQRLIGEMFGKPRPLFLVTDLISAKFFDRTIEIVLEFLV